MFKIHPITAVLRVECIAWTRSNNALHLNSNCAIAMRIQLGLSYFSFLVALCTVQCFNLYSKQEWIPTAFRWEKRERSPRSSKLKHWKSWIKLVLAHELWIVDFRHNALRERENQKCPSSVHNQINQPWIGQQYIFSWLRFRLALTFQFSGIACSAQHILHFHGTRNGWLGIATQLGFHKFLDLRQSNFEWMKCEQSEWFGQQWIPPANGHIVGNRINR